MISLTKLAADKIKEFLKKRGSGIGVMVGVKTTGCSGLAYTIEYVDSPPVTRDHFCYENYDVQVWTDGRSLVYLTGMTIDWVKRGLNEGFEFINPNESARCGCGESFTV